MSQHNTSAQQKWHESSHASLCLLGSYLRGGDFFQPLETRLHLPQKTLKYTPVQQLAMLFVSLLAGAKAVAHTNFTVRPDPAFYRAFGLPGWHRQPPNGVAAAVGSGSVAGGQGYEVYPAGARIVTILLSSRWCR